LETFETQDLQTIAQKCPKKNYWCKWCTSDKKTSNKTPWQKHLIKAHAIENHNVSPRNLMVLTNSSCTWCTITINISSMNTQLLQKGIWLEGYNGPNIYKVMDINIKHFSFKDIKGHANMS
jgi:hypothetical protein